MTASDGPVAVYTAIYGGYDRLIDPVPQDVDVDWYCFTDDPGLSSEVWKVVVEPGRFGDPRLDARWFKMQPHRCLPEHRWTIWVDGNIRIDSGRFVRESVTVAGGGLAMFRHPQRDCVYAEARALARLGSGCPGGRLMAQQVEHYRAAGHPRRWGLWAGGVLVRDSSRPVLRELGEQWLAECERWTTRDQLSFPVVARRLSLRPATFDHHLHRHSPLRALTCRLHRIDLFDALAAQLRHTGLWQAPVASRSDRSVWRSNPWFEIVPHVGG